MTRLYIVDTNVLVSALITRDKSAPTAKIAHLMLAGRLRYIYSMDLLAEYRAVLLWPKVQRLHSLTPDEIDVLLETVIGNGALRETPAAGVAPDPGDTHLVALLMAETRATLITGDGLLLDKLRPRYAVISPREWDSAKPPPHST